MLSGGQWPQARDGLLALKEKGLGGLFMITPQINAFQFTDTRQVVTVLRPLNALRHAVQVIVHPS